MINLRNELAKIRGIDRRFLARLHKLRIKTVKDLLWHFPSRYDDFSQISKICELQSEQTASVSGRIKNINLRRTWKQRMIIVEATIEDETGSIRAVWFNQPYIAKMLYVGKTTIFSGKVILSRDDLCFSSPAFGHPPGLVSVYPETKGLTSKGLRYLIKILLKNLGQLNDFIPKEVLEKLSLPEINTALHQIHFPKSLQEARKSKERFSFDDLFLLQLNNLKIRSQLAKEKAHAITFSSADLKKIIGAIPFELTASQKRSVEEILNDIKKGQPMNRLLQGDVGSGKTVVAAIAALLTAKNNYQAAFMAPTEILAKQHYKTFVKIFSPLISEWNLSVGILTGSEARYFMGDGLEAKKKKADLAKQIEKGEIKIIIGTHAIIQKSVKFKNLALTVVDEQHRFGVKQRAALATNPAKEKPTSKADKKRSELIPHFLSMSATPIPRTLSLTLFGDLELSIIDELPEGRQSIITKIVAPTNRKKAYDFLRKQIKASPLSQAFVICPRIEAGDKSEADNPWSDVKAVEEEYEKLSKKIFPDLKVAMLHGRMKGEQKNQIMNDFAQNKINILVSTSVVEIGIDIPNATIMMIEGADRFGLAQLYQFRGRVGRGEQQSFCLLFTESTSPTVTRRLQSLIEAKNGFELAEKDLEIRGPGEFLGRSQTGLPDLAMESLNNIEMIKMAREAAENIIKKDTELKSYPALKQKLQEFNALIHLE